MQEQKLRTCERVALAVLPQKAAACIRRKNACIRRISSAAPDVCHAAGPYDSAWVPRVLKRRANLLPEHRRSVAGSLAMRGSILSVTSETLLRGRGPRCNRSVVAPEVARCDLGGHNSVIWQRDGGLAQRRRGARGRPRGCFLEACQGLDRTTRAAPPRRPCVHAPRLVLAPGPGRAPREPSSGLSSAPRACRNLSNVALQRWRRLDTTRVQRPATGMAAIGGERFLERVSEPPLFAKEARRSVTGGPSARSLARSLARRFGGRARTAPTSSRLAAFALPAVSFINGVLCLSSGPPPSPHFLRPPVARSGRDQLGLRGRP